MRKGTIHDVADRDLTKAGQKHVIIESDDDGVNPITDEDNLFWLHSRIPREFRGNEQDKDYPGLPLENVLDEDGEPTGDRRLRDDAVMFNVAAYIHSGIVLSLGSGSHFPDQRWDVAHEAGWMWTDKERFEEMCGANRWGQIFDRLTLDWRPAASRAEFEAYLWREAECLLKYWQTWNDGHVFGYRTETSYVPYKRLYEDGRVEDAVDWEDGEDSCWGFITEDVNDIEFPRGNGWEVFDATGAFVGKEYNIPEFVVTRTTDGRRQFLVSWPVTSAPGAPVVWSSEKSSAHLFDSFGECQKVAEAVLGKNAICVREIYDPNTNCAEVDAI